MFKNNNTGIIRQFIRKSVHANKVRNLFLIASIIMVTILLSVVFSSGFSLTDNFGIAQDRFMGTDSNGLLLDIADGNYEDLNALDYTRNIGIQQYAGTLNEEKVEQNIVFTYFDDVEWKENITPSISDIEGTYPLEKNEIMLSRWTAGIIGMENAIGEVISLRFLDTADILHTEEFRITGYYTDYITLNAGGQHGNILAARNFFAKKHMNVIPDGNIAVSRAFAAAYSTGSSAVYPFSFTDSSITSERALVMLANDLDFNPGSISVFGLAQEGRISFSETYLFVGIIVLLIILCGYLLIYNIVSISVVQDMHMYGQLKTLGATTSQIKKVVYGQALLLSAIAIPIGLTVGSLISTAAVPVILDSFLAGSGFGEAMPMDISLSPLLFLFIILFALATVLFSSLKPAKLAGSVSPIEAVRYQEGAGTNKKTSHSQKGSRLSHMAFRNVFRSKKRAFVVFLSLFLGLLIYLIVNVLTYGMDFSVRFEREMPENFKITNFTAASPAPANWRDVLDEDFLSAVENIAGINQIHPVNYACVETATASGPLQTYLISRGAYYEIDPHEEILAIGTDWETLKNFSVYTTFTDAELETLLTSGKGLLLESDEELNNLIGKEMEFQDESYIVAGIFEDLSEVNSQINRYDRIIPSDAGTTPMVYMHLNGIERLTAEKCTGTLFLMTDSTQDQNIQEELLRLIDDSTDIAFNSQLMEIKTYAPVLDTMRSIGIIFSFFLLFLGMLNFINVMITSIYTRKREFAALESIGMTGRQIRQMLILEGLCYCLVTLLLLATLGTAAAFGILQIAREILYFFVFGFPVFSMIILIILLALTCAVIPLIAYRSITKDSTIVERLRIGAE